MNICILETWLQILIFRDSDEEPGFAVQGFPFSLPRNHDGKVFVFAPKSLMSDRRYSEKSFRRARRWLRQCLDHHECGKSVFYPKRLLDLCEDPVRLFHTNEVKGFKEPYACLSHRWGSPEHKRLISTVANIHDHMKGIPWGEIPRTFQDAITVCRRMSVRYLWIDTVCIMQAYDGMSGEDAAKTEADFALENSAMARIYRNSLFTICATMSTSMDSGMFNTKKDLQIQVTADDGSEATLHVMAEHSHDTPPTSLETRGWTYQEYLLPPRVLEFGPFEISWRCQSLSTCECSNTSSTSRWGRRAALAEQTDPPKHVGKETEKWWMRTVQRYTGRSLTNQEDKLPALSGLAQIYHQVTDDTYLAGLWKTSLPHNLCWYHCSGESHHDDGWKLGTGHRPRAFRAPSWSWASIDAPNNAQCRTWWPGTADDCINPIERDNDSNFDTQVVCTIYEISVQPKTDDPFGEVAPGGFLKLGVILISAKIDTNAQKTINISGMIRFSRSPAWTLDLLQENDTSVAFCLPDCEMDDDGLEAGDEVHCAPIVEMVTKSLPRLSRTGCLVLKRLKDQEYRRVGFCFLDNDPPCGAWSEMDRQEPEASQSYVLHFGPDTETRITIV